MARNRNPEVEGYSYVNLSMATTLDSAPGEPAPTRRDTAYQSPGLLQKAVLARENAEQPDAVAPEAANRSAFSAPQANGPEAPQPTATGAEAQRTLVTG
ncbi:MAG: hypothetical protein QOH37_1079 [Nocardioidaceae bacterium]|nr:hypothetical protein [Nocardioidaceae bacterium]